MPVGQRFSAAGGSRTMNDRRDFLTASLMGLALLLPYLDEGAF